MWISVFCFLCFYKIYETAVNVVNKKEPVTSLIGVKNVMFHVTMSV